VRSRYFRRTSIIPPREYAERSCIVVRWTGMPRGGHFAAFEEPELLAEDVNAFLDEVEGVA
jgi:pimeloyl-ACP methyl ester carboxylesterase